MFYSSTTSLTDPNNLWYAIQAYCESTESSFVSQIPKFVQLAEQRIFNTVQLPATRLTATCTYTAGSSSLSITSAGGKVLAIHSISFKPPTASTTEYYLLNKDINFLRESFPDSAATGTPEYYALDTQDGSSTSQSTTSLKVAPTPNVSASGNIIYFGYPASITASDPGYTWLGNNFDTALLYGAIREAYTYLKGETDLASQYEAKYQEAVALLKVLGDGKDRQDSYRTVQARVPVP